MKKKMPEIFNTFAVRMRELGIHQDNLDCSDVFRIFSKREVLVCVDGKNGSKWTCVQPANELFVDLDVLKPKPRQ